jgi:hypothetical protein
MMERELYFAIQKVVTKINIAIQMVIYPFL